MKIDTPSFAFLNVNYSDRIVPTLKDGSSLVAKMTPSQKIGIKVYGCVIGWILSIFGVAVCLRDAHNRIYFANKNSLIGWSNANGANQTLTWRDLETLLQNVYRAQKANEALRISSKDAHTEKECGLCYLERKFVVLQCNHVYCAPCLKEWVAKSPTCPEDRTNLTPDDLETIKNASAT